MDWLRSFTHCSPYHIYHLPIWVMYLNTFDVEHIIYVQDSFFNMNSMVMFDLVITSRMLDMEHIIYVQDSFFIMNSTIMCVLQSD